MNRKPEKQPISKAGEENLVIGTDYGNGDTSSQLNAISRFKAMEGLNESRFDASPRGQGTKVFRS